MTLDTEPGEFLERVFFGTLTFRQTVPMSDPDLPESAMGASRAPCRGDMNGSESFGRSPLEQDQRAVVGGRACVRHYWLLFDSPLAMNHRLRRAVTALAIENVGKLREAATEGQADGGHAKEGCCDTSAKSRLHDTSRIAWAKLMARVVAGIVVNRSHGTITPPPDTRPGLLSTLVTPSLRPVAGGCQPPHGPSRHGR
jgi:hypothetical protein